MNINTAGLKNHMVFENLCVLMKVVSVLEGLMETSINPLMLK